MSASDRDGQIEQGSSVYAALARTFTRALALYFSRPVRLFRPSKVSGWMFLQGLASRDGGSLSPQFIKELVTKHGFSVLPRHFIPPMMINACLGTVLWATYSEASSLLEPHLSHPFAVSMLSGAAAGGAQAIVAAPAENVRLVLEGGGTHAGWSSAWKDVFSTTRSNDAPTSQKIREARQVRMWMKDVGEMAGRGWHGWAWGFAKDVVGFSIFFSVFELTRRTAITLRSASTQYMSKFEGKHAALCHVPRIIHGTTLVGGGVLAGLLYESVGRPFDVARRAVHRYSVTDPGQKGMDAAFRAVTAKMRTDGIVSFFRVIPSNAESPPSQVTGASRRRLYAFLRVLGRVGPWGAGFLIWEAFGPGLSP